MDSDYMCHAAMMKTAPCPHTCYNLYYFSGYRDGVNSLTSHFQLYLIKKIKKNPFVSAQQTQICAVQRLAAIIGHCSQRFGPVNIDFWSNLAAFIFSLWFGPSSSRLVQWYELAAIRFFFFWSILVMFWVRNHHIIVLRNMDVPGLPWRVSW